MQSKVASLLLKYRKVFQMKLAIASNYVFGKVSLMLKAGRISKEDAIDPDSGI